MKSRSWTAAGLALAALALAGTLRAEGIGSAHWKSKMQMAGGPQGDMTTDSEVWMKDKAMRMKMTMMGMNMEVIKSGDFVYQWQEGQTNGMKMPANMRRRGGAQTDYVSKIDDVRTKGKKIGSETVGGHVCEIYQYNESDLKQTYWLAHDLKNFPVKVVTETGSMKATTVNSDIELGVSVPDAMVTPPKDVQFQDMSEMMKGMQQRPN